MSQHMLTPEQVRHEHAKITEEYLDAKEVIKAKRDKKLKAIQDKCPHTNTGEISRQCLDCDYFG